MKSLQKLLLSYLHSGARDTNTNEVNRQILIIYLFSLFGICITGIAAVFAFLNNNLPLSLVLIVSSLVFSLGPITQKLTNNYKLSSGIVLYLLYILMFYLLYTGGANNTGPLWIFMIAPVTLFICGLRNGIINLIIFTLIASSILLLPFDILLGTQYPVDYKFRLLSSFITVSALTSLYEYSRETSYNSMLEISKKFESLSKLDPLTQLSNRRDAKSIIEHEQRRLTRNQTTLSLIICDVDNFKVVNDVYGHDVGDCVLIELAKIFKESIRSQDTVARWGGEEFLFVLPDTSVEQAAIMAKKIHLAINNKKMLFDSKTLSITVSMGISTLMNEENLALAIKEADKNLYKAKNTGKNRSYSHLGEILPNK